MTSFNNAEMDIQNNDALLVGLEPEKNFCEARQCRICLDDEEDENESGLLISPCSCKGSQQWVHRKCLDEWRANNADHVAFSKCMECLTDYRLVYNGPSAGRREYYCYVARDIGVGCTLLLATMLLLGALLRSCFSQNESVYKTMDGITIQTNWAQLLLADLVTGLLLVLVLLGVYGSIVLCKNKCSCRRAMENLEAHADPATRQRSPAPHSTNRGMDLESTPTQRSIYVLGDGGEAEDPETALEGNNLADHSLQVQQPPTARAMNRSSTLQRSSCHTHYYHGNDCCCRCEGGHHHRNSSCCEGDSSSCCCPCEGGSSGGSNDCKGDHPLVVVLVVVGAVLAAIGMVVGVVLACALLRRIFARHLFRLQKKRLTQNYVVQDLSGLDDNGGVDLEAHTTALPPPIAPPADVASDIPTKGKFIGKQEALNQDTPHKDFLRKLGLME